MLSLTVPVLMVFVAISRVINGLHIGDRTMYSFGCLRSLIVILVIALIACTAPPALADEVSTLREQVADLRNQLQQRRASNTDWLLEQQLRELKTTVAMQEVRIRQLEATVRAGSSDVPQPSAMEDNEVITRLRELCRRTAWGEAIPAATCERLGVMQQPPERGDN